MKNMYEVAQVIEAGPAHQMIQADLPGKTHKFLYECDTCTKTVRVADSIFE